MLTCMLFYMFANRNDLAATHRARVTLIPPFANAVRVELVLARLYTGRSSGQYFHAHRTLFFAVFRVAFRVIIIDSFRAVLFGLDRSPARRAVHRAVVFGLPIELASFVLDMAARLDADSIGSDRAEANAAIYNSRGHDRPRDSSYIPRFKGRTKLLVFG